MDIVLLREAHQIAVNFISKEVRDWARGAGVANYLIGDTPGAFHSSTEYKKPSAIWVTSMPEPDEICAPYIDESISHWPNVVLETGDYENINGMRKTATWWIRQHHRKVQAVILVATQGLTKMEVPTVRVELWRMAIASAMLDRANAIAPSASLYPGEAPRKEFKPNAEQKTVININFMAGGQVAADNELEIRFSVFFPRHPDLTKSIETHLAFDKCKLAEMGRQIFAKMGYGVNRFGLEEDIAVDKGREAKKEQTSDDNISNNLPAVSAEFGVEEKEETEDEILARVQEEWLDYEAYLKSED